MNWQDLTELYSENISTLKNNQRQRAELQLFYLKENLLYSFPEAVENPMLIASTPWEKLFNYVQLGGADNHLAFRRAGDALLNTRTIIQRYRDLPDFNDKLDASKHSFQKAEVVYCFAEWLMKNLWVEINTSLFTPANYDLVAQFDKIELFALAVGSPFTLINKENKSDDGATLFKAELGVAILKLLEEKSRNEHTGAALLLADDHITRTLIAPYLPIIKMQISIYLVKSVAEVTELM